MWNFSSYLDRLDEFFFSNVGGFDDYPEFKKVTKMILVLIHDQTYVERSVNENKNLLQPYLEGLLLTISKINL